MNKNIFSMKQQQYDERTLPEWYSLRGLTSWLAASKPMCSAAKLYSFMLDETVTARQAVYYFYAQLAALGVFSRQISMPVGVLAPFYCSVVQFHSRVCLVKTGRRANSTSSYMY